MIEYLEQISFFGAPLLDSSKLLEMLFRFSLNILVTYIIVRKIYKPYRQDESYVFTYFVFNLLIFFLCHIMSSLELGIGFGFGLFALFSIMRYRTNPIRITEMTYLFLVVCVAVINALSNETMSLAELLFINGSVVLGVYAFDTWLFGEHLHIQNIYYERIDLIQPDKNEELMQDLRLRTGLDIVEIEIQRIDFLTDSAVIKVYYRGVKRINKN